MKRILCLVATAAAICAHPAPAQQIETAQVTRAPLPHDSTVLRIIRQRVEEQRSKGIVIGLLEPDGRTRIVAYGDAGPGQPPLDGNTIFEIGSITKAFTGILLADMVVKGDVKLSDPVQMYLPDGVRMPEHSGTPITLAHLAEQNSGLPRLPTNLRPTDGTDPYRDYTVQQMYEFLSSYELPRAPGERYEYSNLAVGLLGHVLALRAKQSYEDLVRTRILAPLGMTNTSITLTPWMRAHLALGHSPTGDVVGNWTITTLAGAGALRSNAHDMLKFLAASIDTTRGPLRRAAALAQRERAPTASPTMRIGLNWHIRHAGPDTVVWHNGGTGGYRTLAAFIPRKRIGVVVLTNSSGAGADDIGFHLLNASLPLTPAASSAARGQNVTLELDRPDWLYHVGDSAEWRIRSDRAARVVVLFTHEQQRLKPLSVDTLDIAANQIIRLRRTMREPGFLRAIVRILASADTVARVATAAFDPDRITPSVELPADFMEFWRAGIADARKVPLDPVMTRMPERSTNDVDVYHVSFQNQRVGSRLYGILSMPKGAGPFPAMLVVPGAGARPYFPSHEWARRGVIHLAIGIHGIPVDRDSLLYNELRATALQNYNTAQVEDRERYYYRRVFVGVVRAGDFIFSLPQFDRKTYVVRGGSQGGGLAIVAGALDPRVTAIASAYPAMSDHLAYLSGKVGGWPHIFADTAAVKAKAEKIETLRYYDVVNFARLLRVPSHFLWGYNDPVVPPRSMYAAYNVITAPKNVDVYPPAVHGASRQQREREETWLVSELAKER